MTKCTLMVTTTEINHVMTALSPNFGDGSLLIVTKSTLIVTIF